LALVSKLTSICCKMLCSAKVKQAVEGKSVTS
jgi:hypothetical protein